MAFGESRQALEVFDRGLAGQHLGLLVDEKVAQLLGHEMSAQVVMPRVTTGALQPVE